MTKYYYKVSLTAEEVDMLYKALYAIKKEDPSKTEDANSVIIKLEAADIEIIKD